MAENLNIDWKQYNFQVFFHHGLKCFCVEVYDNKNNKLVEPLSTDEFYLKFTSFEDGAAHLSKYGYYHANSAKFIMED